MGMFVLLVSCLNGNIRVAYGFMARSAVDSNLIDSTNVAVCISGLLRTFLEPHVQENFVAHLHWPGYKYFLASDRVVDQNDDRLKIPLRNQTQLRLHVGRHIIHNKTCPSPNMTSRHRQINQINMATRLQSCMSMLLHEEARWSTQHHFVFRVRPDCLFLVRLPHAAVIHQRESHGHELLLLDDLLAIAPRRYAAAIYTVPNAVFSSCVTVDAWRYACQRNLDWPTIERMSHCPPCVPCQTMALVTWFWKFQPGLDGTLGWSSWPLGPCSMRLERYTASGNRTVITHSSKYVIEAAQRKEHNCTMKWEST